MALKKLLERFDSTDPHRKAELARRQAAKRAVETNDKREGPVKAAR